MKGTKNTFTSIGSGFTILANPLLIKLVKPQKSYLGDYVAHPVSPVASSTSSELVSSTTSTTTTTTTSTTASTTTTTALPIELCCGEYTDHRFPYHTAHR